MMQEELQKGKFMMNEDGADKEYETLFTFINKDNNKNYVVYTDNTVDETGKLNTFASSYDPNSREFILLPVETEEEWSNIDSMVNDFMGVVGNG